MALRRGYRELLAAFAAARVDYLIVGGYAIAHHASPRFTNDIDLLIRPDENNIARAMSALEQLGAPEASSPARTRGPARFAGVLLQLRASAIWRPRDTILAAKIANTAVPIGRELVDRPQAD